MSTSQSREDNRGSGNTLIIRKSKYFVLCCQQIRQGWQSFGTGKCPSLLTIWKRRYLNSTSPSQAKFTLFVKWLSYDKYQFKADEIVFVVYPYVYCTTWTLTKRLEKKLDGNYTRMLRAVLNKSWRQLYGHLPPITKTIQVRRTRHAGHCWRSKDELISDVLLWTPTYGRAKVGRPARTYIQQLCEDTGCNPEDLPEAMNDREKWRKRVRDIRAGGTTWWWWWWCIT